MTLHANVDLVTLSNTFDEWRTRTNDVIEDRNQLRNSEYLKDESNFRVANGAIYISRATGGTTLINDNDAQISNTLYVLKDTITTRNVDSGNVNTGNVYTANTVYSSNVTATDTISTQNLVVNQTANIQTANIVSADALSVVIDPEDHTYGIFSPGIGKFRHLEVDSGGLAYTGDITTSSDTITLRQGLGADGSGYFEVEQSTGNASIRYNSTTDQWEASNNDVTGSYSKLVREVDIADLVAGSLSSNLIFSYTSATTRTLTQYADSPTEIYTVRGASTSSGQLVITLSSFTPGTSSSVPSSSLQWDVPASSFTITITNPDDWLVDYMTDVTSITATTGTCSALSTFAAGPRVFSAGHTQVEGGADWSQTFTTDADSYMRPNIGSGLTGGSFAATLRYKAMVDGVLEDPYTGVNSQSTIAINWGSVSHSFSIAPLGTKIFLQTFTSTTYSGSASGLSNPSNVSHALTPTGGTVTNVNPTGTSLSGTFTFTTPVTCNNTVAGRSITLDTTFARPASVTGTAYNATTTTTASATGGSFTYPSFWLLTSSLLVVPSRANIISGSSFAGTGESLTQLGDQSGFSGYIQTGSVSKAWWIGKLSTATQPVLNDGTGKTNIKYGASPSSAQNLTTASVTDGGTITLYPDGDSTLSRVYHLYGINIPANSTAYIIFP